MLSARQASVAADHHHNIWLAPNVKCLPSSLDKFRGAAFQ